MVRKIRGLLRRISSQLDHIEKMLANQPELFAAVYFQMESKLMESELNNAQSVGQIHRGSWEIPMTKKR